MMRWRSWLASLTLVPVLLVAAPAAVPTRNSRREMDGVMGTSLSRWSSGPGQLRDGDPGPDADSLRRRQRGCQPAAAARALAMRPALLLADEPSGNLDRETGARLHDLLRRLNRERGLAVVVVTHNDALAGLCDRVLRLAAGRLEAAG